MLESAEASVSQMLKKPRGHLKVSTSVATGQILINPRVGAYIKRSPEVQVQLHLSNRRVDVNEEGMDIAIRIGTLKDSALFMRWLGKAAIHLYASREYLDEQSLPENPKDLRNHHFLTMNDIDSPTRLTLVHSNESQQIKLAPRACVNDFISLRNLIFQGLGIGVLPSYMVNETSLNDCLVRVLPDWSLPSVEFHALFPSIRSATSKIRTFLDFLTEQLAEVLVR